MSNEEEGFSSVTGNNKYLPDWAVVTIAVSPDGEIHALNGDRSPGHPNEDRTYVGLERINEFYICKQDPNFNKTLSRLMDIEDHYKSILKQLEVNSGDGAISKIYDLTGKLPTLKTRQAKDSVSKLLTVINLDPNNRMIRVGLGKWNSSFFIRIDLWYVGFRLTF